jgi:hypothetical protein
LLTFLVIAVNIKREIVKNFVIKTLLVLIICFISIVVLFKFKDHIEKTMGTTSSFDAKCEITWSPFSVFLYFGENFLNWFDRMGSEKATSNIVSYFSIIVVATFFSCINVFNKLKRLSKGKPMTTPEVLFDDISRLDADKSMLNLIKFMINFGFFKFGLEITILAFIVVIYIRHELISIFYFILLVTLALSSRKNAQRFWKFAVVCVTMSLIFQCLLLFLYSTAMECHDDVEFIENESIKMQLKFLYRNLELLYEEPSMLIADFILLMILVYQVSCQISPS